jgi:hypothetical protein
MHRSTRYPVTPTLSVEAVHVRLIRVPLAAEAVKFEGAVGGVVSAAYRKLGPDANASPMMAINERTQTVETDFHNLPVKPFSLVFMYLLPIFVRVEENSFNLGANSTPNAVTNR